jgi:hypothetical protein
MARAIFIYLTPLLPLSFEGEGEVIKKRGFAPLRLPRKWLFNRSYSRVWL